MSELVAGYDVEVPSFSRRRALSRVGRTSARRDLRRSDDGRVWFLQVDDDEAWVAITQIAAGGGGGWFRTDSSLDPASHDWAAVTGSEVLARVRRGARTAAELTAQMVSSCLADGLGFEALGLADALLDRGYSLDIAIAGDSHSGEGALNSG